MTKRANGTGSIEWHHGCWRVRVWIKGKRQTIWKGADRKRAESILAAWLAESADATIIEPGSLTLAALGEEWLTSRELHGSSTREKVRAIYDERSVWRQHVVPSDLAELIVEEIRVRDVEAFARWLRGRKAISCVTTRNGVERRPTKRTIATQTQRNALRLVRQCLDEAIRRELITANPARLVRVLGRTKRLDDDWLRAGEVDQLLGCAEISLRDRAAYACAIGLALRLRDLHALRVADVHLDCAVPGPHVVAAIRKGDGKIHRVPILPWLRPWIEAQLATLTRGSVYLFPGPDGGRYNRSYDFHWAETRAAGRTTPGALERASIERRVRFHDLRGTCATHLALGTWGRTWSLHEIQQMLAHADQRVTERYVRRVLDAITTAAAATPDGPRAMVAVAPGSPQPSAQGREDTAGISGGSTDKRRRSDDESSRALGSHWGQRGGNALELARKVVVSAQHGDLDEALLEQLAREVLEDELVQLALAVRAGGSHAAQSALRLAGAILDRAPAARQSAEPAPVHEPGDPR